jgi:creatinine amidohydrolase
MLAIAPDRVRLDRAEAGDPRPLETLLPLLRGQGVRPVSANGVLGDPSGAGPDEGRALLAVAVDQLVGAVDTWPHDSAHQDRRDGHRQDQRNGTAIGEVTG